MIRVIARLDIKGPNLIKGIHLEGVRVVGNPNEFAKRYYQEGIDEIVYMDAVASLYGRNSLGHLVEDTAKDVFIPMTVGGGLRSVEDVRAILRSGADKVGINTAVVKDKSLISKVASEFGVQCVVISIEAKSTSAGKWEVYVDNGREHTGLDVVSWAKEVEGLGAGEILLTSVDREGTRKGYDIALLHAVSQAVRIPVIASGGFGKTSDAIEAVKDGGADAVSIADGFHYRRVSVDEVKKAFWQSGYEVRSNSFEALT